MRVFDSVEIRLLAEEVEPLYGAMILIAAYSGLRFGELCVLRNDRFDALRKTVRVDKNVSEVGGEFIFKAPKSNASLRTVSIPGFLVEGIVQHLATYPDTSGLVSTTPQGEPIRRTNFRRRIWNPAMKSSVGEPCTLHDLRHTHAALLMA